MRRGRSLRAAIAGALVAAAPAPVAAQASEEAVKAAFMPRFARYVTWPTSARPRPGQPIVICVIGHDPFGTLLNHAIRGQEVDGASFTVRRLSSAGGAVGCDVAFVGGTRSQPVGQLLAAIGSKPVLTVTDASNGGQRGIIHFAIVSGRVRFFIDNSQAQKHGLNVSSRLLALAVGVKE